MTTNLTPTKDSAELQPIPIVNGLDCPACGHPTLILGNGGYITCSLEGCPNPDYAEALEAHTAAQVAIPSKAEIVNFLKSHAEEPDEIENSSYNRVTIYGADAFVDALRDFIADHLTTEHKEGEQNGRD